MVWTIALGIVLGFILIMVLLFLWPMLKLLFEFIEFVVTNKDFWKIVGGLATGLLVIIIIIVFVYNNSSKNSSSLVSSTPTNTNSPTNSLECLQAVDKIMGQWFSQPDVKSHFNTESKQCYGYVALGNYFDLVNATTNSGVAECHYDRSQELVCTNNRYNYSDFKPYTQQAAVDVFEAAISK